MKLSLRVRPGAKSDEVKKINEREFVVSIKAQPKDGEANDAVCRVLADYFGVAPSRVQVRTGFSSRNKIIEIL